MQAVLAGKDLRECKLRRTTEDGRDAEGQKEEKNAKCTGKRAVEHGEVQQRKEIRAEQQTRSATVISEGRLPSTEQQPKEPGRHVDLVNRLLKEAG